MRGCSGIDAPRNSTRIANHYLNRISQPHNPHQTLNKNAGTKSNQLIQFETLVFPPFATQAENIPVNTTPVPYNCFSG